MDFKADVKWCTKQSDVEPKIAENTTGTIMSGWIEKNSLCLIGTNWYFVCHEFGRFRKKFHWTSWISSLSTHVSSAAVIYTVL